MKEPSYHPTDEIRELKSAHLRNVKVVAGLTGSVAVYRIIDVLRELIRRGATVYPVMSEAATELVTPTLLEWATGSKTFTNFAGETGHVALGKEAHVMLIAPATADAIAKLAHGIADNPVTLTALDMMGLGKPVIIVPAMHSGLWNAPQIRESVQKLAVYGCVIIPPVTKEGKAKFPSTEDIVASVDALATRGRDLRGLKILASAGPTREYLDPIRYLTNPSSGRMGLAIAREAHFRGAEVTLIHGPIQEQPPHYMRTINVETTEEMLHAIINELSKRKYDAVVMAAAPADYKFAETYTTKLKSGKETINVKLVQTPKISLEIRKVFRGLMVGFAAETVNGDYGKLATLAKEKMVARCFDIIVANDVSSLETGFTSEYNSVIIITSSGKEIKVEKTLKTVVARKVLDVLLGELSK